MFKSKERKNSSVPRISFHRRKSVKDNSNGAAIPGSYVPPGGLTPEERANVLQVIPKMISYLRQNGLTTHGLFIRNADDASAVGGDSEAAEYLKRITKEVLAAPAESVDQVCRNYDVLTLANALKKILKGLDQELLSANVVGKLVQPIAVGDSQAVTNNLKIVLQDLPHKNFEILKNLCLLLHECSSDNDKLGYMFSALVLLPPLGMAMNKQIAETAIDVMKHMIKECASLFEVTPNVHGQGVDVRASVSINASQMQASQAVFGGAQTNQDPPVSSTFFERSQPEPANLSYTEGAEAPVKLATIQVSYDFEGAEEGELTVYEGELLQLIELGEDDWSTVRRVTESGNVEEGIIPTAYFVQVETDDEPAEQETSLAEPDPPTIVADPIVVNSEPAPCSSVRKAIALFDFAAQEPGELTITTNDIIDILNDSDPEWWYGRSASGDEGLFPMTYVKSIENDDSSNSSTHQVTSPPQQVSAQQSQSVGEPSTKTGIPTRIDPSSANNASNNKRMSFAERVGPPPAAPMRQTPLMNRAPPPSQTPMPQAVQPPKPAFAPPRVPSVVIPATNNNGIGNSDSARASQTEMKTQHPSPPTSAPPPVPKSSTTDNTAHNGTVPKSTTANTAHNGIPGKDPRSLGWTVDQTKYQFYLKFFKKFAAPDPVDGSLSVPGRETADFLTKSGLPRPTVARILELADMDQDGKFDKDEFIVAHHLSYCISKKGMHLPSQLPPYLIPNSKKNLARK